MKKLTTVILMVLVCGAVWGQTNITDKDSKSTPIYHNDGKVGVGTDLPSSKLDVSGMITSSTKGWNLAKIHSETNDQAVISLKNLQQEWRLITQPTQAMGKFYLYNQTKQNAVLVAQPNGNIGIGTTNISEKLSLFDSGTNQVTTQYCNKNTGLGKGNGFIVGIEAAGNGVIWNRENHYIRFGTNATERMRITNIGYVGIGTNNPKCLVDIVDNEKPILRLRNPQGGESQVGIELVRSGDEFGSDANTDWRLLNAGGNLDFQFQTTYENINNGELSSSMYLQYDGKVGIGTTTPSATLDVAGNIKAHEIEVTLAAMQDLQLKGTLAANNITYTANGNTADFVFEDNYQLKDLSEVEAFIKSNKHLPEIPSATEMEEAGVNLAEMNKLLLMKVEELTLYAIEQKAEAERLKAEVGKVRSNESEVRSELEKEREERRAMRGEIEELKKLVMELIKTPKP
jgi:hypothetical protein